MNSGENELLMDSSDDKLLTDSSRDELLIYSNIEEMSPLLPVETKSFFKPNAPQQSQGIKIIFRYTGKQASNVQCYQVSQAVIFEIADRLATAFEKIVRQSGTLSKEPTLVEFAKAQQGLAEVKQYRLYLFIRHNQLKYFDAFIYKMNLLIHLLIHLFSQRR